MKMRISPSRLCILTILVVLQYGLLVTAAATAIAEGGHATLHVPHRAGPDKHEANADTAGRGAREGNRSLAKRFAQLEIASGENLPAVLENDAFSNDDKFMTEQDINLLLGEPTQSDDDVAEDDLPDHDVVDEDLPDHEAPDSVFQVALARRLGLDDPSVVRKPLQFASAGKRIPRSRTSAADRVTSVNSNVGGGGGVSKEGAQKKKKYKKKKKQKPNEIQQGALEQYIKVTVKQIWKDQSIPLDELPDYPKGPQSKDLYLKLHRNFFAMFTPRSDEKIPIGTQVIQFGFGGGAFFCRVVWWNPKNLIFSPLDSLTPDQVSINGEGQVHPTLGGYVWRRIGRFSGERRNRAGMMVGFSDGSYGFAFRIWSAQSDMPVDEWVLDYQWGINRAKNQVLEGMMMKMYNIDPKKLLQRAGRA